MLYFIKDKACTYYGNLLDIHASTQHIRALPLIEVLRYSALNTVEIHNGIMLDFYPGLPHIHTYCKHNLHIRLVLHSKFSYSMKAAGTIWETTRKEQALMQIR